MVVEVRDLVTCQRFVIKEEAKEMENSLGSCTAVLTRGLGARLVYVRFVTRLLTVEQKEHRLSVYSNLLECLAAHEHFFKTLSLFPRIMNILKSERFEGVKTVKRNATQLLEIRKTEREVFLAAEASLIAVSTQKERTSKGISPHSRYVQYCSFNNTSPDTFFFMRPHMMVPLVTE